MPFGHFSALGARYKATCNSVAAARLRQRSDQLDLAASGGQREDAEFVLANVRANRPAEAGGVSLARDSGEAAARQAYIACRSGSG